MPKKTKTIIPLHQLRPFFHKPMSEASKQLGACLTIIKNSCRAHGIPRWPYPEIQRLHRTMDYLKRLLELDSQGVVALHTDERVRFENRCKKLEEEIRLKYHPEKGEWKSNISQTQWKHKVSDNNNTERCEQHNKTWSCSSDNHYETNKNISQTSPFPTPDKVNDFLSASSSNQTWQYPSQALDKDATTISMSQKDPCFLLLQFILRIGTRGVRTMGPELITEMAKIFFHSDEDLANIGRCVSEIRNINSRLQCLENNLKEINNQNERLLKLWQGNSEDKS